MPNEKAAFFGSVRNLSEDSIILRQIILFRILVEISEIVLTWPNSLSRKLFVSPLPYNAIKMDEFSDILVSQLEVLSNEGKKIANDAINATKLTSTIERDLNGFLQLMKHITATIKSVQPAPDYEDSIQDMDDIVTRETKNFEKQLLLLSENGNFYTIPS